MVNPVMSDSGDYEDEWKNYFKRIISNNENYIKSLELFNLEDIILSHNTESSKAEDFEYFLSLFDESKENSISSVIYKGIKYIYVREIRDDNDSNVLIFMTTENNEEGKKTCAIFNYIVDTDLLIACCNSTDLSLVLKAISDASKEE
ncbi:hypothetical protein CWI38_0295p0030 [Hamiltosporidium tvaerminnensis]|uniref:Uncharacterized protein n=2 Tax=Hamiltosporidium TaxID=1176354 RepID=A0A4Q9M1F2_9MICR|nr:hypothetical protein CWI36_1750p0010 [Hamiltosporidium magnivora]TBU10470.1 hypothetical protein CWI38_1739p0020 [Hamiltosporidium tvaerminnensis]TBU16696.1 hypothetical protein CWI38_0295p0030 [Hamiltosporidium tvaerminnensis]